MIHFDKTTNAVVMDLVDLEHCGFSHDEFLSELFLSGILDIDDNLRDPQAGSADPRFPMAIIVNVGGGHILTEGTSEDKLAAYRARRDKFAEWLKRIGVSV